MEPVLSVVCEEPEGVVTRNVFPMPLSVENLKAMWEKSSQFKTLFTTEVKGDFKKFVELFLRSGPGGAVEANGLVWVVDDFVGIFYMTNIRPYEDANVHYSFFDRRHKGREILVREMLRYVFIRYNFNRLSAEVPLYVTHHVFHFAESIGFVKEGRKRSAVLYEGAWFDVNMYGILRKELLDGNQGT